jgi:hypothetical protein
MISGNRITEPHPFVHPLARGDLHLTQEFMLTEVALLLARDADDAEWTFELELMDTNSGEDLRRMNAFLFIYTVARYSIAAAHAQPSVPQGILLEAGARTLFLNRFLTAVGDDDASGASSLWEESSLRDETCLSTPAIRSVLTDLLSAFSVVAAEGAAPNVADHLPAPYSDPGSF